MARTPKDDAAPETTDFVGYNAPAPSSSKTVEAWALAKGHASTNRQGEFVPDWQFGAARAVEGWGQGRELSEAQYDAAVSKAIGSRMLSGDLIERK